MQSQYLYVWKDIIQSQKLFKIETECSSQRPPALVSAPVLVYNNNGH